MQPPIQQPIKPLDLFIFIIKTYLFLAILSLLSACSPEPNNTPLTGLHQLNNQQSVQLSDIKQPIQIINLWAPWCPSCREEMPILATFFQKHRQNPHLAMIGIGLDHPSAIRSFIANAPIDYPQWYFDGLDTADLMLALNNTTQALPYTVVRAPRCHFEESLLGSLSLTELEKILAAAEKACQRTAHSNP